MKAPFLRISTLLLTRALACGLALVAVSPAFAEGEAVRVCTHPAPGFFTRDSAGRATGLEFDLLTSFATAANLTMSFSDAPSFDQLLKDTEAGVCQIGASTVTVTEERKARFLFSMPYFPNRIIIVQKKSTAFSQPADLKDRRVAVVKGTLSSHLVGDIQGVKALPAKDDDAAFAALLKGEADALACDSAVLLEYLGRHSQLAIAFPIGERSFFAFALPKTSKLVTPLDEHLKGLMKSGEFKKLLAKYFGSSNAEMLAKDVAPTPAK